METLLANALQSKLKYYLRSYSREQFRLQGRTVQLSNLDLNGDVLHAIIGLPSTLRVAQARVGKLEITLPALANVNTEPTVVAISKLDLVLEETAINEPPMATTGSASTKSTSYTLADKIADGMTVEVGVVNLMLQTRGAGSANGQDAAAWTPPIANITIRNMLLYTTNENWEVVNLSATRQFFKGKKTIYVFRKLEWQSLSIDLLPHPDMFTDDRASPSSGSRDGDGAKRAFFGGERFVDNISGNACITMHRTDTNNPLGLEVNLKLSEAIAPALSEPGLRALMRFIAGMYVCMNRPDMRPMPALASEVAGRSFLDVSVETIFLRIKESDFQLELVLQSLHYLKGSVGEGDVVSAMSRLYLGNMFLRDTFSYPPTTLLQPGMPDAVPRTDPIPPFASDLLWPRIYPLPVEEDPHPGAMIRLYSAHTKPAPEPPTLSGQLVIRCSPLKITLQEESCFRIASLLADTHIIEQGAVTVQNSSLRYLLFALDEFDVIVPVPSKAFEDDTVDEAQFTGARLRLSKLQILQDPFLRYKVLQVDRDAACYAMWEGQPVDAGQRRYAVSAEKVNFTLETGSFDDSVDLEADADGRQWGCLEFANPRVEMAVLSVDGSPLEVIPPPGGTVRIALSCREFSANTSRVQLLFVLQMYSYIGKMSRALVKVSKGKQEVDPARGLASAVTKPAAVQGLSDLATVAPGDSAVSIQISGLRFRVLESIAGEPALEGPTLAQFLGGGISLRITFRSLGDSKTAVIQSQVLWQDISVDCVETDEGESPYETGSDANALNQNLQTRMRPIFWKGPRPGSMAGTGGMSTSKEGLAFMDINVTHVIPYRAKHDSQTLSVTAKIGGVRLGGGMGYNEALLRRFGVLDRDGTPGKDIVQLISVMRESGTLANFLGTDELKNTVSSSEGEGNTAPSGESQVKEGAWDMSLPDEMDIDVQLLDWLFALEGAEGVLVGVDGIEQREDRCWHSTFRLLRISAANKVEGTNGQPGTNANRIPINTITMQMEGIQALKPRVLEGVLPRTNGENSNLPPSNEDGPSGSFSSPSITSRSGLDLKLTFVNNEDSNEPIQNGKAPEAWSIKSIITAVQEPTEVEVTKVDMEHLFQTCKMEVGAATRIAAGGLKLLQLQGSPLITQSTIDQLVNLGARAVTGRDFLKAGISHGDEALWQSKIANLEIEVGKAQELCQELVKDLVKAWVRDPKPEDNSGEEGGVGDGRKEMGEGGGEVGGLKDRAAAELEAARKVAVLTEQLEHLQTLLEEARLAQ